MPEELSMMKRFRKRFILITMALIAAVTFVVFTAIVVMEYQKSAADIDAKLAHSAEHSASDPMGLFTGDSSGSKKDSSDESTGILKNNVGTVWISYPGVYTSTLRNETDFADSQIIEAAQSICSTVVFSGQSVVSGSIDSSGLYFKAVEQSTGVYKVSFIPQSELWGDFGQRALTLYVSWLMLMVSLLIVVVFLSRYVTRPVEQAWREQQRFIADASHELKTPLTVILANASILKDNPDKTVAEQDAWVEGIYAEAESMQRLTEDMLTLAQADSGADLAQLMGRVDFSSVVEGQVLQFDAVAFERGLTIQDDVMEDLEVLGDELRLENMVKTLLENACKYAPRSTEVEVRLERSHGNAVLAVHNGGDPIPAEDLPHLFDRFYRSDKARTHEGEAASFGLGLSIAKSTAELHGGTIEAASDETGSTFTVKIPLAKGK